MSIQPSGGTNNNILPSVSTDMGYLFCIQGTISLFLHLGWIELCTNIIYKSQKILHNIGNVANLSNVRILSTKWISNKWF